MQISIYQTNNILIKANHFDYSADTRNFALVICDSPMPPLWRSFNATGPQAAQDGWLLECVVASGLVADPMYFEITNAAMTCDQFFTAIPYAGPQVQLSGPQPYDTVSNIVSLQATITDLSGINPTNEALIVTVNGDQARYSLSTSNIISLDTHYAPNGVQEIEAAADCFPTPYGAQDPPLDTTGEYASGTTLQLDFENHVYVVNSGNYCSPDAGTNMILFGLDSDDTITAWISDPSSGQIVAYYSGSAPAGYVGLPWNFTEADGVTPYTNTSYAVTFVANDPTGLSMTNVVGDGVRPASGVIMTYAYEDPNTTDGALANSQANTFIAQTLAFLYNDIYDGWGLTQYTPNYGLPSDIGTGRNNVDGMIDPMGTNNTSWRPWLQQALGTSSLYSDLNFGPAHGSARLAGAIGDGSVKMSSNDAYDWTHAVGKNWRMRKVAMWACNTIILGQPWPYTNGIPKFRDAFGIYPKDVQDNSQCWKNAGVFFGGPLNQVWVYRSLFHPVGVTQTAAQAEEYFDEYWVTGPNEYPGGCDPTYGIHYAADNTVAAFPQLTAYGFALVGWYYLPYSGSYDDQLMMGNYINIHYP